MSDPMPLPLFSCQDCGARMLVSTAVVDRMFAENLDDARSMAMEMHSHQCLGQAACPRHVNGALLADASHGNRLRCTTNGHYADEPHVDVAVIDDVPTWRELWGR